MPRFRKRSRRKAAPAMMPKETSEKEAGGYMGWIRFLVDALIGGAAGAALRVSHVPVPGRIDRPS